MTAFWKQALEAAGWTALETFLAVFSAGLIGVTKMDWSAVGTLAIIAGISAAAAAVSLLKSVIVRNVGAKNSTLLTGPDPIGGGA